MHGYSKKIALKRSINTIYEIKLISFSYNNTYSILISNPTGFYPEKKEMSLRKITLVFFSLCLAPLFSCTYCYSKTFIYKKGVIEQLLPFSFICKGYDFSVE